MKMVELRELTNEELNQKIEDCKEELFNFRFQNSRNQLENPMKIKEIRKDVAHIKTLLTERRTKIS